MINATFNNISVISWPLFLSDDETGENHHQPSIKKWLSNTLGHFLYILPWAKESVHKVTMLGISNFIKYIFGFTCYEKPLIRETDKTTEIEFDQFPSFVSKTGDNKAQVWIWSVFICTKTCIQVYCSSYAFKTLYKNLHFLTNTIQV